MCPGLPELIESGTVEVMWQPPTDDLLDAYGHRLLEAVHRRGVRRLFIDGLGALQYAAGSHPRRISNFLTALMNELRVLGVTTVYTLEVPDIMGPNIRNPIGDLSSLAENLILLRFVELGASLHRLVSVLKVRDSAVRLLALRVRHQQPGPAHQGHHGGGGAHHHQLCGRTEPGACRGRSVAARAR